MMDMDYGMGLGIAAVLGVFLVFFVIIGIILYVLYALGLYTMAKNKSLENPWMAWIPILQHYTLGKIIRRMNIGSFQITNPELVLPIASAVTIVLGDVQKLGVLLGLVNFILMMIALYTLYKMYKPESATLYTVLSVILMFLIPIFVFILRNNEAVGETIVEGDNFYSP